MFIRTLTIFLLLTGFAYSQNSHSNKWDKYLNTDTLFLPLKDIKKPIKEEKTTLKNILIMQGVTCLYGLIDYAGYNLFKDGNEGYWRFTQGGMFVTANHLLAKHVSTKSAIGFSLQVWGGVPDAVYYGVDKISGGFGGFSNGDEFNMHKNLSHLNFMPTVIGGKTIRGVDLITNVILTTAISIIINL